MALVTDKQFYLENALKEKIDFCFERYKKNWDHFWLVDGDEGAGKSTFVFGLAYYICSLTGKTLSTKNIFFSAEELMRFASKTEGEVIIFDEAVVDSQGSDWQNKTQQKLIKVMKMVRKKRHWFIFVMPDFYDFKKYFVRRASGIIHIYSEDDLSRGTFVYFDKLKKMKLYATYLRQKYVDYKEYSFRGRFADYQKLGLIDLVEYDRMKDYAISKIITCSEVLGSGMLKFLRLKWAYANLSRYSKRELADNIKTTDTTISRWASLGEKYPEIAQLSRKINFRRASLNQSGGLEPIKSDSSDTKHINSDGDDEDEFGID